MFHNECSDALCNLFVFAQGVVKFADHSPYGDGFTLRTTSSFTSRLEAHTAVVKLMFTTEVFREAKAAHSEWKALPTTNKFSMLYRGTRLDELQRHKINVFLYRMITNIVLDVTWLQELTPLLYASFHELKCIFPKTSKPPEFALADLVVDVHSIQGFLISAQTPLIVREAETRLLGRRDHFNVAISVI